VGAEKGKKDKQGNELKPRQKRGRCYIRQKRSKPTTPDRKTHENSNLSRKKRKVSVGRNKIKADKRRGI